MTPKGQAPGSPVAAPFNETTWLVMFGGYDHDEIWSVKMVASRFAAEEEIRQAKNYSPNTKVSMVPMSEIAKLIPTATPKGGK